MFDASRQSFPASALLCLLMTGLFAARFLLHPMPVEAPSMEGMPLAAALSEFSALHPSLGIACNLFFVWWTLLIVARLALKYAPAGSSNYLPAQMFLIAATGITVPAEALGAAISAWLLALAVRQGISSLHKGYRFAEVFRAGLYLGALPILYAPATLVAVGLAAGTLSIYRRSGRETVVCLAGLLLPVPTAGFLHWAFGADADFIYRELWRCAATNTAGTLTAGLFAPAAETVVAAGRIAASALALFIAFAGVGRALTHKRSMRKTPYKFMSLIALMLAMLIVSTTVPGTSPTLIPLVAVASALAVPYSFSGRWAVASSVAYTLLMAVVLALNLSPFADVSIP